MVKKKEEKSPGLISVLFAGLMSAWLGLLIAAANLVTLEVVRSKKSPTAEDKAANPGKVFFVAGDTASSKDWRQKRESYLKGTGTLVLTERDLNTWIKSVFPKPNPAEAEGQTVVAPPNFRIADDKFQIASDITFSFRKEKPVIFQTRGGFMKEGRQYVFKPEVTFLGSCPIPNLGPLPMLFFNKFATGFSSSEEYTSVAEPWIGLQGVGVTGEGLKLVK